MSLDQTTTIQGIFGLFEAVFVLTFAFIIMGIPLVLYYLETTGALPRLVQFRKEHATVRMGPDVMGISSSLTH